MAMQILDALYREKVLFILPNRSIVKIVDNGLHFLFSLFTLFYFSFLLFLFFILFFYF